MPLVYFDDNMFHGGSVGRGEVRCTDTAAENHFAFTFSLSSRFSRACVTTDNGGATVYDEEHAVAVVGTTVTTSTTKEGSATATMMIGAASSHCGGAAAPYNRLADHMTMMTPPLTASLTSVATSSASSLAFSEATFRSACYSFAESLSMPPAHQPTTMRVVTHSNPPINAAAGGGGVALSAYFHQPAVLMNPLTVGVTVADNAVEDDCDDDGDDFVLPTDVFCSQGRSRRHCLARHSPFPYDAAAAGGGVVAGGLPFTGFCVTVLTEASYRLHRQFDELLALMGMATSRHPSTTHRSLQLRGLFDPACQGNFPCGVATIWSVKSALAAKWFCQPLDLVALLLTERNYGEPHTPDVELWCTGASLYATVALDDAIPIHQLFGVGAAAESEEVDCFGVVSILVGFAARKPQAKQVTGGATPNATSPPPHHEGNASLDGNRHRNHHHQHRPPAVPCSAVATTSVEDSSTATPADTRLHHLVVAESNASTSTTSALVDPCEAAQETEQFAARTPVDRIYGEGAFPCPSIAAERHAAFVQQRNARTYRDIVSGTIEAPVDVARRLDLSVSDDVTDAGLQPHRPPHNDATREAAAAAGGGGGGDSLVAPSSQAESGAVKTKVAGKGSHVSTDRKASSHPQQQQQQQQQQPTPSRQNHSTRSQRTVVALRENRFALLSVGGNLCSEGDDRRESHEKQKCVRGVPEHKATRQSAPDKSTGSGPLRGKKKSPGTAATPTATRNSTLPVVVADEKVADDCLLEAAAAAAAIAATHSAPCPPAVPAVLRQTAPTVARSGDAATASQCEKLTQEVRRLRRDAQLLSSNAPGKAAAQELSQVLREVQALVTHNLFLVKADSAAPSPSAWSRTVSPEVKCAFAAAVELLISVRITYAFSLTAIVDGPYSAPSAVSGGGVGGRDAGVIAAHQLQFQLAYKCSVDLLQFLGFDEFQQQSSSCSSIHQEDGEGGAAACATPRRLPITAADQNTPLDQLPIFVLVARHCFVSLYFSQPTSPTQLTSSTDTAAHRIAILGHHAARLAYESVLALVQRIATLVKGRDIANFLPSVPPPASSRRAPVRAGSAAAATAAPSQNANAAAAIAATASMWVLMSVDVLAQLSTACCDIAVTLFQLPQHDVAITCACYFVAGVWFDLLCDARPPQCAAIADFITALPSAATADAIGSRMISDAVRLMKPRGHEGSEQRPTSKECVVQHAELRLAECNQRAADFQAKQYAFGVVTTTQHIHVVTHCIRVLNELKDNCWSLATVPAAINQRLDSA